MIFKSSRKDIDLSFTTHPLTGDLATKSGVAAINQSLRNIVLTNFYERGYFVEYGTNVKSSLFENNVGDVFFQGIRQNVIRAIENFEPQVEIIEVEVFTPDDPNAITINIYYSVINTLEEQQLSINF
jgi:phage baseplate assembly protein W